MFFPILWFFLWVVGMVNKIFLSFFYREYANPNPNPKSNPNPTPNTPKLPNPLNPLNPPNPLPQPPQTPPTSPPTPSNPTPNPINLHKKILLTIHTTHPFYCRTFN